MKLYTLSASEQELYLNALNSMNLKKEKNIFENVGREPLKIDKSGYCPALNRPGFSCVFINGEQNECDIVSPSFAQLDDLLTAAYQDKYIQMCLAPKSSQALPVIGRITIKNQPDGYMLEITASSEALLGLKTHIENVYRFAADLENLYLNRQRCNELLQQSLVLNNTYGSLSDLKPSELVWRKSMSSIHLQFDDTEYFLFSGTQPSAVSFSDPYPLSCITMFNDKSAGPQQCIVSDKAGSTLDYLFYRLLRQKDICLDSEKMDGAIQALVQEFALSVNIPFNGNTTEFYRQLLGNKLKMPQDIHDISKIPQLVSQENLSLNQYVVTFFSGAHQVAQRFLNKLALHLPSDRTIAPKRI